MRILEKRLRQRIDGDEELWFMSETGLTMFTMKALSNLITTGSSLMMRMLKR
ncbi:unnamed protein product [Eruca vesicaria subsp. sativa]|uniref:Uncharacterized protein n=1 Tax=Eruca vesicaria subsp. sativa TaxID=29727 RepID=A0ABC8KUC9_ERUVS|nr:unnamed protein product [Eruca vesicaria subsp. sativa]